MRPGTHDGAAERREWDRVSVNCEQSMEIVVSRMHVTFIWRKVVVTSAIK